MLKLFVSCIILMITMDSVNGTSDKKGKETFDINVNIETHNQTLYNINIGPVEFPSLDFSRRIKDLTKEWLSARNFPLVPNNNHYIIGFKHNDYSTNQNIYMMSKEKFDQTLKIQIDSEIRDLANYDRQFISKISAKFHKTNGQYLRVDHKDSSPEWMNKRRNYVRDAVFPDDAQKEIHWVRNKDVLKYDVWKQNRNQPQLDFIPPQQRNNTWGLQKIYGEVSLRQLMYYSSQEIRIWEYNPLLPNVALPRLVKNRGLLDDEIVIWINKLPKDTTMIFKSTERMISSYTTSSTFGSRAPQSVRAASGLPQDPSGSFEYWSQASPSWLPTRFSSGAAVSAAAAAAPPAPEYLNFTARNMDTGFEFEPVGIQSTDYGHYLISEIIQDGYRFNGLQEFLMPKHFLIRVNGIEYDGNDAGEIQLCEMDIVSGCIVEYSIQSQFLPITVSLEMKQIEFYEKNVIIGIVELPWNNDMSFIKHLTQLWLMQNTAHLLYDTDRYVIRFNDKKTFDIEDNNKQQHIFWENVNKKDIEPEEGDVVFDSDDIDQTQFSLHRNDKTMCPEVIIWIDQLPKHTTMIFRGYHQSMDTLIPKSYKSGLSPSGPSETMTLKSILKSPSSRYTSGSVSWSSPQDSDDSDKISMWTSGRNKRNMPISPLKPPRSASGAPSQSFLSGAHPLSTMRRASSSPSVPASVRQGVRERTLSIPIQPVHSLRSVQEKPKLEMAMFNSFVPQQYPANILRSPTLPISDTEASVSTEPAPRSILELAGFQPFSTQKGPSYVITSGSNSAQNYPIPSLSHASPFAQSHTITESVFDHLPRPYWLYLEDGIWKPFDSAINQQIEAAYLNPRNFMIDGRNLQNVNRYFDNNWCISFGRSGTSPLLSKPAMIHAITKEQRPIKRIN